MLAAWQAVSPLHLRSILFPRPFSQNPHAIMTKKLPHRSKENPNALLVSPKRGLAAGASRYSGQRNGPDVNGMTNELGDVTTASGGQSQSPSQSRWHTQSSRRTTFSTLPSADEIKDKRAWTVARTLEESEDGSEVTVQWQDTMVADECVRRDKDHKVFVWSNKTKHYIAERSCAEVDSAGKAIWRCKWEPSTIPKEWMEDLDVEGDEDSEEGEDFQAQSELGHISAESDSSVYSSGPDTPSSASADTDSASSSDAESEADFTPLPSTAASSDAGPPPLPPSSPLLPSSPPQLPSLNSSPSKPRQSIEDDHDGLSQHESARSSSSVDLSPSNESRKAWPTELHFAVAGEDLDYGPAVFEIIKGQLGKGIANTTDRSPPVVERRMNREIRRPLKFRSWTARKRGHQINLRTPQKAQAALVHMQGEEVGKACDYCAKGGGVFQGCVTAHDFGKGECTNCHYQNRGKQCDLRGECVVRISACRSS